MGQSLVRRKIKCRVNECHAACCYNIPMDKGYFSAYRKKTARPIIRFEDAQYGNVIAVTDEDWKKNKCPFLNDECRCNIYDVRPSVCRKFGVDIEESKFLRCPHLGQCYEAD